MTIENEVPEDHIDEEHPLVGGHVSRGCVGEDYEDDEEIEGEDDGGDPGDMDGDAESALASCGWGTDEDYEHDDTYGNDGFGEE